MPGRQTAHWPQGAGTGTETPEGAEDSQAEQGGPPLTVMTMEEPMTSDAITSALASRLAALSIWSPTRVRCASSMPARRQPRL